MPLLEHVSVAPDRIVALGFGVLKHQGLVAIVLLVIIVRKIFVHFSLVRKFGHRLLAIAGVYEMRPRLDDLLEELADGLEHLGSAQVMRLYQCLPPGQALEHEGHELVLVALLQIHEAQPQVLDG